RALRSAPAFGRAVASCGRGFYGTAEAVPLSKTGGWRRLARVNACSFGSCWRSDFRLVWTSTPLMRDETAHEWGTRKMMSEPPALTCPSRARRGHRLCGDV